MTINVFAIVLTLRQNRFKVGGLAHQQERLLDHLHYKAVNNSFMVK
jgi:hypothetical protein